MKPLRLFLVFLGMTTSMAVLCMATLSNTSLLDPTHRNLRYSDAYSRETLDLWLPESDEPTPIIIYFHGGGFKQGNKDRIVFKEAFLEQVPQGVAIASVGYPLIGDQGKQGAIEEGGYFQVLAETQKAIRFLQEHAAKYNLDPKRFIIAGSSAGAVVSEYLTYRQDLGIAASIAIQQPYAVDTVKNFIRNRSEAPLILFTFSGPEDTVHSPAYAEAIKAHCEEVGVPCIIYGTPESGLPQLPEGTSFPQQAMEQIEAFWATPAE